MKASSVVFSTLHRRRATRHPPAREPAVYNSLIACVLPRLRRRTSVTASRMVVPNDVGDTCGEYLDVHGVSPCSRLHSMQFCCPLGQRNLPRRAKLPNHVEKRWISCEFMFLPRASGWLGVRRFHRIGKGSILPSGGGRWNLQAGVQLSGETAPVDV